MAEENINNSNRTTEPESKRLDSSRRESSRNRNLMIIFGSLLVVVVVVLILVLASGDDDDHYTIAVNYIRGGNYEAALIELEKIKPTDKNYVDAVSTINFVKGVQQYRNNMLDEALLYFTRVDPSDRFYSEAKNFISEIERMKGLTQQPDTVYLVDTVTKPPETGPDTAVTADINIELKNFAVKMLDTMKRFEEIYIESETVTSGFDVYKDSLIFIMNNFNRLSSDGTDPELQILKGLINNWMGTLIKYIDAKMTELTGTTPAERPVDIKRESIRIRSEIDPLISSVRNRYRIL